MTEFECFIFLIGVATGVALATVYFVTSRWDEPVEKAAPRVRTRIRGL